MNTEKDLIDKSVDIVKEAMKDVISEFLIKLNGGYHIVYIHSFEITENGKVTFDFSTPSEMSKEVLVPHIEKIFKTMIDESIKKRNKFKFF